MWPCNIQYNFFVSVLNTKIAILSYYVHINDFYELVYEWFCWRNFRIFASLVYTADILFPLSPIPTLTILTTLNIKYEYIYLFLTFVKIFNRIVDAKTWHIGGKDVHWFITIFIKTHTVEKEIKYKLKWQFTRITV